MKKFFISLMLLITNIVNATTFSDLKFGQYQFSDTQWNVSACLYTNTCQIYSLSGIGTTYNLSYAVHIGSTQYIGFTQSNDPNYPWHMYLYNSNGTVAQDLGTGRLATQGQDSNGNYFFFFTNQNYNGTVFSLNYGFATNSGFSFTGIGSPTVSQTNTMASNGSTTPLNSGQTGGGNSLCCGGSSSQFNADITKQMQIYNWANRSTNDSQVYITQIGNDSSITVNQIGSKNNYVGVYDNGSNNTININQTANNNNVTNYSSTTVNGSSNTVNVTQNSSGGAKASFINASNNTNNITVTQSDTGNHWADISVTGGNKTVNVSQSGSAGQMASVQLSGNPTSLTLQQSGATQNFYSIQFNCGTAGGCSPINVKQGN